MFGFVFLTLLLGYGKFFYVATLFSLDGEAWSGLNLELPSDSLGD